MTTLDRSSHQPAYRRILSLFSLGMAVGGMLLMATTARATERWATLQAIHWVENPNDRQSPGACGELGAYQFRAETWRMHSRRPFDAALDRRYSDEVAVLHYEWIKSGLARKGVPVTVYNIAMAWNAGINAVVRDDAPASSRDYASRVNNLAAELRARVASNR